MEVNRKCVCKLLINAQIFSLINDFQNLFLFFPFVVVVVVIFCVFGSSSGL